MRGLSEWLSNYLCNFKLPKWVTDYDLRFERCYWRLRLCATVLPQHPAKMIGTKVRNLLLSSGQDRIIPIFEKEPRITL
jgi:hypothetical protein